MVDLQARSPVADMLPISAGSVTLTESRPEFVTLLQPRAGRSSELSAALETVHGMKLPELGGSTSSGSVRVLWFAREQYLLVGDRPANPDLSSVAALTDQSDAWIVLALSGSGSADVLARHCPLDLRSDRFAVGQTARVPVAHLPSVLVKLDNGFEVIVMQSLARSAVHHLGEAMTSVAAQARLG